MASPAGGAGKGRRSYQPKLRPGGEEKKAEGIK
jgi:hypothetical protein